jgi:hypothetical protein
MLQKMSELTTLRQTLQIAAAALDVEAAAKPGGKAAIDHLKLTDECSDLDTKISILADKIWKKGPGLKGCARPCAHYTE